MNEQRGIDKLIEAIRSEPNRFKMASWYSGGGLDKFMKRDCGTAACIGGWIEAFARVDLKIDRPISSAEEIAWLGIDTTEGQMAKLFIASSEGEFGYLARLDMKSFDRLLNAEERSRAGVRVLEILRDTGRTDWPRALQETGLADRFGPFIRNE